ncbi:MAG: sulfatase [Chlorobi bacterium]|nr:sulfatase [Chlorobiota bacterium]
MKYFYIRHKMLPVILVFVISVISGCSNEKKQNLNFIIIMADDLGYGDLSCYGNPVIETPNIDMLAQQGMRFTQYCSVSSECTPARAGLITGRYPARYGMAGKNLKPNSVYGLPDKEITIAEYLKSKGYTTSFIGKWHLGTVHGSLPNEQGFDYFFGLPFASNMSEDVQHKLGNYNYEFMLPLIEQKDTMELDPDLSLLNEKLTRKALSWLDENSEKPFFMYFSYPVPHVPLYASGRFKGKSKRGIYGDVVMEIDYGVKRIVEKLKEKGLDKNTIIIFTSDNGPWLKQKTNGGSAGPLRNGKGSVYEGGFRVPFILWGPGTVAAKGQITEFMTGLDVFPTIIGLTGDNTLMVAFDGRDMSRFITEGSAVADKPFFYFSRNGRLSGVRYKNYKLIKRTTGNELYQIEHDPAEKYNLAGKNTFILNELENMINNLSNSLKR